jgi:hypothetical protein
MRKLILVVFCSICILAFSLSSASITKAEDFWVVSGTLAPGWSAESVGEFPFLTSAIAFDSENIVYTNDISADWGGDTLRILRGEAPDSGQWDEFVSFLRIHDVVNGLDFDAKGNLFVSVVVADENPFKYPYPDAGLIRKIRAHTLKVSDPIEFVDIPLVGDFRPTGVAAIGKENVSFPGRKWSKPDWGNIYGIESFKKYEPNTEPTVIRSGSVWTGIADDRWGQIYGAVRHPVNSVYTSDYEGSIQLIAQFNKYVEELAFDSKGNLYALEGAPTDGNTEVIKLIPPHVVIDGCDTGIIDWPFTGGSTIGGMIEDCKTAYSHGDFVSCVVDFANQLKQDVYINAEQMVAIITCAAQANLP